MDCPSEIKMIEGLMEGLDSTAKMEFDLDSRTVNFTTGLITSKSQTL